MRASPSPSAVVVSRRPPGPGGRTSGDVRRRRLYAICERRARGSAVARRRTSSRASTETRADRRRIAVVHPLEPGGAASKARSNRTANSTRRHQHVTVFADRGSTLAVRQRHAADGSARAMECADGHVSARSIAKRSSGRIVGRGGGEIDAIFPRSRPASIRASNVIVSEDESGGRLKALGSRAVSLEEGAPADISCAQELAPGPRRRAGEREPRAAAEQTKPP